MTRGYTLLEILVAVTLMLMIMLGLTQLFSRVGTQINNTQATLQIAGELRSVKNRLENDLKMVTADLTKAPPMKTGLNRGYFCIIEGMGAAHTNTLLRSQGYVAGKDIAHKSDSSDQIPVQLPDGSTVSVNYDNTVGDMDDILMFTAYAPVGQSFRGLVGGDVRESNMAEIILFCRGNTLYRRTLLILPDLEFQEILANDSATTPAMRQGLGFYQRNDVSVRINPDTGFVVANSLEDLAQRQNRFGHAVTGSLQQAFPFNIHKNSAIYYMRMPTMLETSHPNWDVSQSFAWNLANCLRPSPSDPNPNGVALAYNDVYNIFPNAMTSTELPNAINTPFIDYWEHPFPWSGLVDSVGNAICNIHPVTGTPAGLTGTRYAEDVLLTNVISFDIQVWDEVAGRWVNLGEAPTGVYADGVSAGPLGGQGNYPLSSQIPLPCTYDTWSDEFEREGNEWPNQSGTLTPTRGRNQKDDLGTGVIDHISEWTTPPPYNVPLRGVKITIRTFDPLSKNIREMTVVHNFVGQ